MVQKHGDWCVLLWRDCEWRMHEERVTLNGDVRTTVSIMDLIMYEAQRQGRLSFYLVRWILRLKVPLKLVNLTIYRCLQVRKV